MAEQFGNYVIFSLLGIIGGMLLGWKIFFPKIKLGNKVGGRKVGKKKKSRLHFW